MENSMLEGFIRGNKLRRWLSRDDCPQAIKECKSLFDEYVGMPVDTLEDRPVDEQILAPELQQLLQTRTGILRSRLRYNKIIYATSSTHFGNSLVQFYPGGNMASSPVPGCVQHIVWVKGRPFLLLQQYLQLPKSVIDPYAAYIHLPAKMYSSKLSESLELVELEWVISHVALWPLSHNRVVILSLSRD
jgi:hypothetical protein